MQNPAEKQLDRVPYADHPRIVDAMLALENNPRPPGCRKLFDDVWRTRVGNYCVIYKIDDARQEIIVGKIARRREDTYRAIEDLF